MRRRGLREVLEITKEVRGAISKPGISSIIRSSWKSSPSVLAVQQIRGLAWAVVVSRPRSGLRASGAGPENSGVSYRIQELKT